VRHLLEPLCYVEEQRLNSLYFKFMKEKLWSLYLKIIGFNQFHLTVSGLEMRQNVLLINLLVFLAVLVLIMFFRKKLEAFFLVIISLITFTTGVALLRFESNFILTNLPRENNFECRSSAVPIYGSFLKVYIFLLIYFIGQKIIQKVKFYRNRKMMK
jgi:hypothetical protein